MSKRTSECKWSSWTKEPHDVLVKGKGYQPPFLAGAGDVHFELDEYVSASWSWILTKDWKTLKIRPLTTKTS